MVQLAAIQGEAGADGVDDVPVVKCRDYVMIESIVKSDHRPVHCEYVIRAQPTRNGNATKTLQLTLTHLAFEGSETGGVEFAKVCCPLPCEDCLWEQRQVISFRLRDS